MSAKSSAVTPVAADSATAGSGSDMTLAAFEHRLALFHEGAAALDVVFRVEALLHQPRRAIEIGLAIEAAQLFDRPLGRMHGKRRILADQAAVVVDVGVELGLRHDAVDQPHAERFLCREQPAREEYFLRAG